MNGSPLRPSTAPAGIEERNKALSGLAYEAPLALDTRSGFSVIPIEGIPGLSESAFYHEVDKTLVITDLAFNVQNPKGLGARIIFHLFGTYKRFSQSRLVGLLTKDKAAAKRSMQSLLELDFERVVMAHGQVVDADAKARLRKAFRL